MDKIESEGRGLTHWEIIGSSMCNFKMEEGEKLNH